MRWEDERYVRLYTRDTIDWLSLSFEAQGVLSLLLRKCDRAGLIRLGKHGAKGVAAMLGHAHRWSVIGPALDELLADGCVAIRGDLLVLPNFVAAQEAQPSEAARKRAQRERDRDKALAAGVPEKHSGAAIEEMAKRARADKKSLYVVTPDVQNEGEGVDLSDEVSHLDVTPCDEQRDEQEAVPDKKSPQPNQPTEPTQPSLPNQPNRTNQPNQTAAEPTDKRSAVGGEQEFPLTASGCWQFIQAERQLRDVGREKKPPPGFEAWHASAEGEVGPDGITRALRAYFDDPHFRRKNWATGVFIQHGVWHHRAKRGAT